MFNPISSDHNSRRDDVFSQGNNDKPDTRDINAGRTGNSPGHALHNAGSQPPVNVVQEAFSRQFSQKAAARDSFHRLMRQTFARIADPETTGTTTYNYAKAEALRQQALDGDLSWLPEVEVLSNATFSKAQLDEGQPSTSKTALGAFGDETIMLNESVFSDPELALRVYSEEAGHALDIELNQDVDSAGDEGAIFQKLLSGEKITTEQMNALKAENDHGILNNKEVEFETAQDQQTPDEIFEQEVANRLVLQLEAELADNPPADSSLPSRISNIASQTEDIAKIFEQFRILGEQTGQARHIAELLDNGATALEVVEDLYDAFQSNTGPITAIILDNGQIIGTKEGAELSFTGANNEFISVFDGEKWVRLNPHDPIEDPSQVTFLHGPSQLLQAADGLAALAANGVFGEGTAQVIGQVGEVAIDLFYREIDTGPLTSIILNNGKTIDVSEGAILGRTGDNNEFISVFDGEKWKRLNPDDPIEDYSQVTFMYGPNAVVKAVDGLSALAASGVFGEDTAQDVGLVGGVAVDLYREIDTIQQINDSIDKAVEVGNDGLADILRDQRDTGALLGLAGIAIAGIDVAGTLLEDEKLQEISEAIQTITAAGKVGKQFVDAVNAVQLAQNRLRDAQNLGTQVFIDSAIKNLTVQYLNLASAALNAISLAAGDDKTIQQVTAVLSAVISVAIVVLTKTPSPLQVLGAILAVANAFGAFQGSEEFELFDGIDASGNGLATDKIKHDDHGDFIYVIRDFEGLELDGISWRLKNNTLSFQTSFAPINPFVDPGKGETNTFILSDAEFDFLKANLKEKTGSATGTDPRVEFLKPYFNLMPNVKFKQDNRSEGIVFYNDYNLDGRPERVTTFPINNDIDFNFKRSGNQITMLDEAGNDIISFDSSLEKAPLISTLAPFALNFVASHPDLIERFTAGGNGVNVTSAVTYVTGQDTDDIRDVTFNPYDYLAANPDLIEVTGGDTLKATIHYIEHGFAEGRATEFDGLSYIASHPDLIEAIGANDIGGAQHFVKTGHAEGRTTTFNPLWYLASNPALIDLFGTDPAKAAEFYITTGPSEEPAITFHPHSYLAANPDLIAEIGTDANTAALHYINTGLSEGRPTGYDPENFATPEAADAALLDFLRILQLLDTFDVPGTDAGPSPEQVVTVLDPAELEPYATTVGGEFLNTGFGLGVKSEWPAGFDTRNYEDFLAFAGGYNYQIRNDETLTLTFPPEAFPGDFKSARVELNSLISVPADFESDGDSFLSLNQFEKAEVIAYDTAGAEVGRYVVDGTSEQDLNGNYGEAAVEIDVPFAKLEIRALPVVTEQGEPVPPGSAGDKYFPGDSSDFFVRSVQFTSDVPVAPTTPTTLDAAFLPEFNEILVRLETSVQDGTITGEDAERVRDLVEAARIRAGQIEAPAEENQTVLAA